MCELSCNLGASTSWKPQGLSRPVMGFLYLFTVLHSHMVVTINLICSMVQEIMSFNKPIWWDVFPLVNLWKLRFVASINLQYHDRSQPWNMMGVQKYNIYMCYTFVHSCLVCWLAIMDIQFEEVPINIWSLQLPSHILGQVSVAQWGLHCIWSLGILRHMPFLSL